MLAALTVLLLALGGQEAISSTPRGPTYVWTYPRYVQRAPPVRVAPIEVRVKTQGALRPPLPMLEVPDPDRELKRRWIETRCLYPVPGTWDYDINTALCGKDRDCWNELCEVQDGPTRPHP